MKIGPFPIKLEQQNWVYPPCLEKLKFLDIGIQGFAPDLGGLLVSHTGGG